VKKEKKFNKKQRTAPCFCSCSYLLFILIVVIVFFVIHPQNILASPLNYVPLDSWVYSAISRLETLRAFAGNNTVATNTLPLTRIEIAHLIDTALFNIQKGKNEFKDWELALMEKLVLEFQEELASIDVEVISINSDTTSSDSRSNSDPNSTSNSSSNSDFSSDPAAPAPNAHPSNNGLYESLKYFAQHEKFCSSCSSNLSLGLLNPQMSRKDMAILLDEIIYQIQTNQTPLSTLSDQDLEKLEALIIALNDELSSQGLKIVKLNKTTILLDNIKTTLEFNPYFTQRVDFLYPGNQSKLFSELGVKVSAALSESSALYLDYSLEMDYLLDRHLTHLLNNQLNQAYLTLALPSFEIRLPSNTPFFPSLSSLEFPALDLVVGRDSMKWGPGYQGNLVLSTNAPAFDMLKYSGTVDLSDFGGGNGSLNFTKFFSLLDPLKGEDRYFTGQRLEYKPFDYLTLGLSETAIISQESSPLFLNPLPFIPPYYLTRWIADVLGQPSEINSYVGLDVELNFSPGIKLYGEFMADDFILTPKTNPYPNRTGYLAGLYFADPLDIGDTDFRIEYTHINNYVYYSTHPWQDYLYQGEYIGDTLGPDADRLYLELTHQLSDKIDLSLSYTHQRHGEGQVGLPLPSDPIMANENIFLSGIIEKKQAYQAEISYEISPQWALSASATLNNIKNIDNMVGEKEKNTYFQMELNYEF